MSISQAFLNQKLIFVKSGNVKKHVIIANDPIQVLIDPGNSRLDYFDLTSQLLGGAPHCYRSLSQKNLRVD